MVFSYFDDRQGFGTQGSYSLESAKHFSRLGKKSVEMKCVFSKFNLVCSQNIPISKNEKFQNFLMSAIAVTVVTACLQCIMRNAWVLRLSRFSLPIPY